MSNVTISIGGRHYTVACGDGEEAHIERLGRLIDGKVADLANMGGQSEARTLLFAALLLADEVHELTSGKGRAAASEQEKHANEALDRVAETLETLAERLENEARAS